MAAKSPVLLRIVTQSIGEGLLLTALFKLHL
jgi:hypothetical protein